MIRFTSLFSQALVLLALAGCAAVRHMPAQLAPAAPEASAAPQALAHEVEIMLATGYQRKLKAGSQWMLAGRIAQGTVYRPYKDVFTLEGAHVHEAYLVVENGQLVGFYLPAERGYSPQQPVIPFPLQQGYP